jgi:ribose transport system ATP-binding protein
LLHSTEIPELVYLCDRVLVCYAGRLVCDLAADQLSEEAILRAALGGEAAPRRAA